MSDKPTTPPKPSVVEIEFKIETLGSQYSNDAIHREARSVVEKYGNTRECIDALRRIPGVKDVRVITMEDKQMERKRGTCARTIENGMCRIAVDSSGRMHNPDCEWPSFKMWVSRRDIASCDGCKHFNAPRGTCRLSGDQFRQCYDHGHSLWIPREEPMSKKDEALTKAWDETVRHVQGKISDLTRAVSRRPATFVGMMEVKAEIMKLLLDAFPMSGTMCPYCLLYQDATSTIRRTICSDCEYRSVHGECDAGSASAYRRIVSAKYELRDLIIEYAKDCPEPKDDGIVVKHIPTSDGQSWGQYEIWSNGVLRVEVKVEDGKDREAGTLVADIVAGLKAKS